MKVRIALAVAFMTLATISASAQLNVSVSGNSINYSAGGGLQSDTDYCVTEVLIDGRSVLANGNAPPCRNTPTNSGTISCNTVGVHVISAYAGSPNADDPPLLLGQRTVTVSTLPPTSCLINNQIDFEINDGTDGNERRVLLSRTTPGLPLSPNPPYPRYQELLSRDRAILVPLRTVIGGVQTSGVDVVLKVIDVADGSPYVAGGPGVVQPVPGAPAPDNIGTTLPTLNGSGITPIIPTNTYAVTSGANGYIAAEMELHATAKAGDNWRVIATMTLPDGSGTVTKNSATITAWKRLYIEKKQMFKRGLQLATDAPAGIPVVVVPDLAIGAAGERFARNDNVMLLHAPPYGQPKNASSYHSGFYQIIARPRPFTAAAPAAGRGTVSTFGTTQVRGTRTRFTAFDPGDVINIEPAPGARRESRVILTVTSATELTVDQPFTFSATDTTYTTGDPNLIVGTRYFRLTLDRNLGESYQREPLAPLGVLELNDSIVRLAAGGITPGDYYDTTTDQLVGDARMQWSHAFPAAYTEYHLLGLSGATANPVPRANFPDGDALAQWFINKWLALPTPTALPPPVITNCGRAGCAFLGFHYTTPENHQLVLVGDSPVGVKNIGQTYLTGIPPVPPATATMNERSTILDRGFTEQQVLDNTSALYQLNVGQIMEKILIHELAHQWSVNTPPPAGTGHCQRVGYDSQGNYPTQQTPPAPTPADVRFCTMAVDPNLTMPAPWNNNLQISQTVRQYGNGVTTFHIVPAGTNLANADSEYLTIRRTEDPWKP
jgi:hypothetical protein